MGVYCYQKVIVSLIRSFISYWTTSSMCWQNCWKMYIFSAVKSINHDYCIWNKALCWHNVCVNCVYLYVYMYKYTHVYIFKKHMLYVFLYILYIHTHICFYICIYIQLYMHSTHIYILCKCFISKMWLITIDWFDSSNIFNILPLSQILDFYFGQIH